MAYANSVKFRDESNVAYGVKHVNNKPRISSMPYLYDIAEGNVSGHEKWSKIGFAPAMTASVITDVWSYSATQPVYVFPTVAAGLEVVSTDNDDDIGVVIHSGTATGGTTTSLINSAAHPVHYQV